MPRGGGASPGPGAPSSLNWKGVVGKPYVTVTPNGPTDGGDYGPNTPSTTTLGIQEAIASLTGGRTWSEKVKIIGDVTGTITQANGIHVPSYTEIEIDGTLKFTNNNAAFENSASAAGSGSDSHIRIHGKGSIENTSVQGSAFILSSVDDIEIEGLRLTNFAQVVNVPAGKNVTRLKVRNNVFDNYNYGIIENGAATGCSDWLIQGNTFLNTRALSTEEDAVVITPNSGGAHRTIKVLDNFFLDQCIVDIEQTVSDVLIRGNSFIHDSSTSPTGGIFVGAGALASILTGFVIDSNYFDWSNTTTGGFPVDILGSAPNVATNLKGLKITKNYFYNFQVPNAQVIGRANSVATFTSDTVLIEGNTFDTIISTSYLVQLNDSNVTFRITNNTIIGATLFFNLAPGTAVIDNNQGYSPAPAAISVTASPFAYTNQDNYPETVLVQGGTVSEIDFGAGANYNNTGLTQGAFYVKPGWGLKVTYSGAPTMTKYPDEAGT